MKKIAVAAAVAAFALMGAMSGCTSDEVFTAQTYVGEGEVRSVSVDVSDRAVVLAPSEDGKLRIEYYESDKTSYSISLSEEGVLSVTLDLDQSWTDFVGVQPSAEYRTIRVCLPQELTDVSVSTTNEAISATGTISALPRQRACAGATCATAQAHASTTGWKSSTVTADSSWAYATASSFW